MWPFDHLLEAWAVARTKFPPASDRVLFQMVGGNRLLPSPDHLACEALQVAIAQIGCGETSNNCGPDVERFIAPAKAPQNWCGAFAGWCYQEAARHFGIPLPFQRSLGAKKLGANVAAVGRRFTDPAEAKPGDLMIFDRGSTGSWQGHVAIVRDVSIDIVHTVEGNSGPKVMERARCASKAERFAFFASLRR